MFENIRRRLTLGYIGIFALLLVILGAVVTASFAKQAATQQDNLLEQRAQGDADFVAGPLLDHYQEGRERGKGPPGPFQWATDQDLGMVALVPGGVNGEVDDGKAPSWTRPLRLTPLASPLRGRHKKPRKKG